MRITEHLPNISNEWNHLLPEDKVKYSVKYAEEKKVYEKKLAEWEKKMLDLGHGDLVRKKLYDDLE